MSSTVTTTLIIDNISISLTSALSQRRAESLASRPLAILSKGNNDQKDEILSDTTLRILYQRLEH